MSLSATRSLFATRWNVLVGVTGAAVLWLAIWVFSEMVDDTPKGEFSAWDEPVIGLMRGGPDSPQASAVVVSVARAITSLGSAPTLLAVTVAGLAWLAWRRRWHAVTILAVASAGAWLATLLLKGYFMRARPSAVPHLVEESSWSFPSGHALASAAVYLTLSVLLAWRLPTWRRQLALVATAFFLSFLIGLSRIYLGVHYPTDVLAGWSAGTAWAIICSASLIAWEFRHGGGAAKAASARGRWREGS